MAANTKTPKKAEAEGVQKNPGEDKMALGMRNYLLMLIGLVIIIVGFALMSGGASSGPDDFNYEMFSFRRITLSTIVTIGGFAFVAYGIMSKGKCCCRKKEK